MEKYTPEKKKTKNVIFFLHGGGYILGNSNNHRDWAIAQSHALGNGDVYMLDYRYAPDGRYPAALDDAVAAYKAILDAGVPAERIILAGDSAGGNLATVLALYCRDHGLPMPAVLVLYLLRVILSCFVELRRFDLSGVQVRRVERTQH